MSIHNAEVQTQLDREMLATKSSPATFERIEEYKVVLENLAQYGSRRLTTNTVFVGFNTLFLAAIASILSPAHFDSWWLVAKVAVISLTITPVNIIWLRVLLTYRAGLADRYNYIKTIEQEFQRRRREPGDTIGLFSKLYPGTSVLLFSNAGTKQNKGIKHRHTTSEMALAWYFTVFYPLILLGVAVMVYLVTNGHIPQAS